MSYVDLMIGALLSKRIQNATFQTTTCLRNDQGIKILECYESKNKNRVLYKIFI